MSNQPIARISVRRKEGDSYKSYSVLSAWPSKIEGLINVQLDKGSEKYPAMGLLDAIKAVAAGASLEVRTSTGKQPARPASPASSFSDDSDVPF